MSHLDSEQNDSRWMTRRRFAWLVVSGAVFFGGMPATYLLTKRLDTPTPPPTTRKLLGDSFKGLTSYEATVLRDVAALIIPTDDLPGSTEAGVVYKLDQLAVAVHRYRKLYQLGVTWLDQKSRGLYGTSSFLDLAQENQVEILQLADHGEMSYIEKNLEWILHGESHVGKRFFDMVKKHTFQTFYTSSIGWQIVQYQRPPQWSGHPDYFRCG
ncbi:MAG: gluconate 2-dehydrogenase subunit 3 family protein [Nitrospirales bacterium]